MNHAGAKIPPVIHTRLEGAHAAGATHLRLLVRGRLDDHSQEILLAVAQRIGHVEDRRGEHADMRPQTFAVQEELGLIVHAFEVKPDVPATDFLIDGEGLFVKPGALGDPFTQQTVAVHVGVRDLSQLPQVVIWTAGNRARSPAAQVAAIGHV